MEMLKHTPMIVEVQFYDEMYGGAMHTVQFGNVIEVGKIGEDFQITTADQTSGMTASHVFNKHQLVSVDIRMGAIQIEESKGDMF